MLAQIPAEKDLEELLSPKLSELWMKLTGRIEAAYQMEKLWGSGGKSWDVECKYRRGGKTLCTLYGTRDRASLLIILGQKERDRFKETRVLYSPLVQSQYDAATTYHDGKWIFFPVEDDASFEDWMRLLAIKRKPNR